MIGSITKDTSEDIVASLIKIVGEINRRVSEQERQLKLFRNTVEILIENGREIEEHSRLNGIK